jgi:hypothetical protein
MSVKIGAENHPLFDQVQTALKVVTAEAVARETAVNEQSLTCSEGWAAWQSRWLEETGRLTACLDGIRGSQQRADGLLAEADAELARVEEKVRDWLKSAAAKAAAKPGS